MMNKLYKIMLFFLILCVFMGGCQSPASNPESSVPTSPTQDTSTTPTQDTSTEPTQGIGTSFATDFYISQTYTALVERALEEANPSQKEALNQVATSYPYDVRKIMTIMGWLPADTPRLDLETVRAICEEFDDKTTWGHVLDRFNAIVGAPDFYGGSGLEWCRYYFDEEEHEYIDVDIDVLGYMIIYKNLQTNAFEIICSNYPAPEDVFPTDPTQDTSTASPTV